MIPYTKNNQNENEFLLQMISFDPEENNNLLNYDFPLTKTVNSNNINQDKRDINSFCNNFKIILERKIEPLPISNKSNLFFINRETPPVRLYREILNFLSNRADINIKIFDILSNEAYLNNNAIENVMNQLISKEIKYKKWNKEIDKEIDNIEKKKLGRKTISDETMRNHNKYSSDNITNKIKTILKKYIISFVNEIINNLYTFKERNSILNKLALPINNVSELIKDVDYKSTTNKKKKKDNLILLNYSLKEFFSLDLSGRYKTINKNVEFSNYNQKIMKYLLKDDKHCDIFNFVLKNFKVEDFLDVFLHTKELSDFPLFNNLKLEERQIIDKSLERIETYLKVIFDDNDKDYKNDYVYLICFLLLIYNYRRYFSLKNERNAIKQKQK
jgi:hypothetical protein